MSTDAEWEKWGRRDPYFGVITDPKYRKDKLTPETKRDFFESGRIHVEQVLNACRTYFDPGFAPKRVLDFGCGVGRVALPFAAKADEVVGLDISDAMLEEARRNCSEHGIANAVFRKSDDLLSALNGTFDLIHTVIVLQHLAPERGTRLFEGLLRHLAPGGLGAVQLTYAKRYYPSTFGAPPVAGSEASLAKPHLPWLARLKGLSWKRSKTVAETSCDGNLNTSEPASDPEMQMNPYNLNQILFLMQVSGVTDFHAQFTDHGGELGVFLYFRKPGK